MSIISLAYSSLVAGSRFEEEGLCIYIYIYIYIYINFVFVRARTRIMAEIVGKSVLVIIRLKELAGVKRYDLMSSFQTKSFHELLWPRLGYRIQRQALKRKALVCTRV